MVPDGARGPIDRSLPVLLPTRAPDRDRGDVATEFEAVMLKGMVEALRKTSLSGEESGGQLIDHLIDDALATHLAKSGGVGLAALFSDAGDEPMQIPSTEMQLQLRSWLVSGADLPAEQPPESLIGGQEKNSSDNLRGPQHLPLSPTDDYY